MNPFIRPPMASILRLMLTREIDPRLLERGRHLATPAQSAKTPLGSNQSMTYRHVGVIRQTQR